MDLKQLGRDSSASLAITLIAIPQGVAYAMIAGLPPAVGLYASAIPAIVGSIARSSKHVVTGPTNALSLLVGGFITGGAVLIDPVAAAMALALLVGLFQVLAGVLRLGAIVDYISRAVVLGYITGAGLLIGLGQLGNLTGTAMGVGGPLTRLHAWSLTLGDAQIAPLTVGAATVALIVGLRRFAPKVPGPVVAMMLGIAASWLLDLRNQGVRVVGDLAPIAAGLPPLALPDVDLAFMQALLPVAFAATVLSLVESSSVARSIAARSGQRLEMSREFIGQGLANIAAGVGGGYPISGSLSRSGLNYSSGATSRFSGALSGVLVILMLLVAGPVMNLTPIASLAGLLLVVAYDLVDVVAIRYVLRALWGDRLAFLGTLIGTWTLSLDKAIYLGVAISLVLFVRRASNLNIRELAVRRGKIRESALNEDERLSDKVRAIHVEGSLFFGAANELSDALDDVMRTPDVKVFIVRLKRARGVDYTTAQVLIAARRRLEQEGRHLLLVGMVPAAMDLLHRVGVTEVFPDEALYPTEREWFVAMDRAMLYARGLVDGEMGATPALTVYLDERERWLSTSQSVATPVMAAETAGPQGA
ncbi:MAG: SulP family inorganic anion transporter [Proteobacteria bacterium]|nr:SulP family inorganic anion transporter [Pseudomonadota bacterium]